jgi:hypothetical protein
MKWIKRNPVAVERASASPDAPYTTVIASVWVYQNLLEYLYRVNIVNGDGTKSKPGSTSSVLYTAAAGFDRLVSPEFSLSSS